MERAPLPGDLAPARTSFGTQPVDWAAVIAGGVVAAAIGLVFTEFGAALGLSAVSPLKGEGSASFALWLIGGWMLITALLSYGAGGYVAGRMRHRVEAETSDETTARDTIHGLIVWALGALVGAWLLAGAIGSAATAVGSVAKSAASAAGSVTQGVAMAAGTAANSGALNGVNVNPLDIINQRLLRGTGVQVTDTTQISKATMTVLASVASTGTLSPQDEDYLAAEVAAGTNLSPADAKARVEAAKADVMKMRDDAKAKADELANQARTAANDARRAAILSAFALAAAMLLAAGTAVWGATRGGTDRDANRLWAGFRSF